MPKPNDRNTKPLKIAERDITRTCREYLELRGWRPVRINAGAFGKSGMPDFLFVHYRRGTCFWCEFKRPGGRLGPKQVEWIAAEKQRGALVIVCDGYDGLVRWYEEQFGVEGQLRLGEGA